jgi:hypothetical protein
MIMSLRIHEVVEPLKGSYARPDESYPMHQVARSARARSGCRIHDLRQRSADWDHRKSAHYAVGP